MHRLAFTLIAPLLPLLAPASAAAETIGGNPGPQYNYVCPHADGQAPLDCFFDAVEHLYTMCRNVKAIEILEFGYENSQEGVNSAKYDSCVEKQKHNMDRPYQAALKETRGAKPIGESVRNLHEHWVASLQKIRWNRGESDADYKARVAGAYDDFRERIGRIRTQVAELKERTAPVASAHAHPGQKPAKAAAKKPAPANAASARDKAPQS